MTVLLTICFDEIFVLGGIHSFPSQQSTTNQTIIIFSWVARSIFRKLLIFGHASWWFWRMQKRDVTVCRTSWLLQALKAKLWWTVGKLNYCFWLFTVLPQNSGCSIGCLTRSLGLLGNRSSTTCCGFTRTPSAVCVSIIGNVKQDLLFRVITSSNLKWSEYIPTTAGYQRSSVPVTALQQVRPISRSLSSVLTLWSEDNRSPPAHRVLH